MTYSNDLRELQSMDRGHTIVSIEHSIKSFHQDRKERCLSSRI